MLTQITIIKLDADRFKITFFNETSVEYFEIFDTITEILAEARSTLEDLQPDPRSAYAQDT